MALTMTRSSLEWLELYHRVRGRRIWGVAFVGSITVRATRHSRPRRYTLSALRAESLWFNRGHVSAARVVHRASLSTLAALAGHRVVPHRGVVARARARR